MGLGFLTFLFYPWGLILQGLAILHFIRRRPDTWWLWVILLLGPIGAIVYLLAEAVPDLGLLRGSLKVFPRRKRIRELEIQVRDNHAPGIYEELGDLYMDDGKLTQARTAFDNAIAARADTLDPFYRRGVCALLLNDAASRAARPRTRRRPRAALRLRPRRRPARPRLRADRTKGQSGCALSPGHGPGQLRRRPI